MYVFFFGPDCLYCFRLLLFAGLPYFSPDLAVTMSCNAYASSLKNLGRAFRTKGTANSTGGSGSGAHREDGTESAAPTVNVEVILDPPSHEDPPVHSAPDIEDMPRPKRMKTQGMKSPLPQNVLTDDDTEETKEESGPETVGIHFVNRVANIVSEIPSKADWEKMEESGLNNVIQKCAEHWGHVSFTLFSS